MTEEEGLLADEVDNAGNEADDGHGAGSGPDGDIGNRIDGGAAAAVTGYVVRALATDPDAVTIDTEERGRTVRFSVRVAPEDMGRVIGRRGRVAQAIRTVVAAAAARDGRQATVDIVDD
ncbi:MAG: KH domain-containing protein [Acidimicrobiales bacterium]